MRPSDFSSTISANFSPALNQVDASPVVTDISSSYVSPPAPSPLASLSSLPHAARKVAKLKKLILPKTFSLYISSHVVLLITKLQRNLIGSFRQFLHC